MVIAQNVADLKSLVSSLNREITVIAASKTQTSETVEELMRLAPDFVLGENRVQEFRDKYDPRFRWHLIGQLQTNKVKYVVGKAELIHSLDREELAREIDRCAAKADVVQACLVEVNMGAEITKGGVLPEDTADFIRSLAGYSHIRIEGLMSVMPNLGDTPQLDALYDELENLYRCAKKIEQSNLSIKYLSAGMSNDYKIALRHGSNMIRVGRIIFGERIYPEQN